MTLVGVNARGEVHAARVGQRDNLWTALCSAPVLALAMLSEVHEHKATDGPMCKRCRAHLRAALDEGSQNCGD